MMAAWPAAVVAAVWLLVMTPLTTTAFASTTYSLTITNVSMLNDLGCVEVNVPASFVIQSVGEPVAPAGRTWVWYQNGNTVVVHAESGGDRLRLLESMTFTIQAQATQAGTWSWTNHAHRQQDCTGIEVPGLPVAVTVLPAVIATPTPLPSPLPTAVPTLLPTAVPTLPPLSTPLPTLPPLSTPLPTLPPLPDSTTEGTPGPASTPPPGATAEPVAVGGPSVPTGGAGSVGRIAELGGAGSGSVSLGSEVLALLDDPFLWFVPGAVVGVPGLLVLLWIALQAVGALAWIPAVRRMSGEPLATRRRRRRPAQT
jgi:hypothetical protein